MYPHQDYLLLVTGLFDYKYPEISTVLSPKGAVVFYTITPPE